MSDEIRTLIVGRATAHEIQRVAIEQGMTALVEDGFAKVRAGETTITEVLRVTS